MTSVLQDIQVRLQDPSIPWQTTIVGVLLAVGVFETYINARQRLYLSPIKYPRLPSTLAPYLPASSSQENYTKSQAYSRDKLAFGTVTDAIDLVNSFVLLTGVVAPLLDTLGIDLGQSVAPFVKWPFFGNGHGDWTLLRGLWTLAGKVPYARTEVKHSLAFVAITNALGTLVAVPIQYYRNFVLEDKHGFNKMTRGTFVADTIKSSLVSLAIELPLIAALLKIIDYIGSTGILRLVAWLMAFIFTFQLVMIPAYPYLIAPLFNKFTPLPEDSPVYPKVKALADRLDFPLGRIWVIDGSKRSSHSNAYFYGLPLMTKHIVIFDTLLDKSSPEEVEAILAHELGHWKGSHIVILLGVSLIQTAVSLLTFTLFLYNQPLLSSFGFLPTHPNSVLGRPTIISLLLASTLFAPVSSVLHFVTNTVTRRLEYDADAFACRLGTEYAENLKGALASIHEKNLALTMTDHVYSAYHHNHPTLIERLDALDNLIDQADKDKSRLSKKEK